MSEQLTSGDLDRIEAAIRQFDADGGGNTVIADKIQMQDYVSRADTLALVAALRAAWASIENAAIAILAYIPGETDRERNLRILSTLPVSDAEWLARRGEAPDSPAIDAANRALGFDKWDAHDDAPDSASKENDR